MTCDGRPIDAPLLRYRHTRKRPAFSRCGLWRGFGFPGAWTIIEQNRLLGFCFGLSEVDATWTGVVQTRSTTYSGVRDKLLMGEQDQSDHDVTRGRAGEPHHALRNGLGQTYTIDTADAFEPSRNASFWETANPNGILTPDGLHASLSGATFCKNNFHIVSCLLIPY